MSSNPSKRCAGEQFAMASRQNMLQGEIFPTCWQIQYSVHKSQNVIAKHFSSDLSK